ncbi:hypothetical protein H0H92_010239 [Tricholoma furcatifolium]|nr:hypothetical protein H0H92_010239 [Tricholoma furcatifolium]
MHTIPRLSQIFKFCLVFYVIVAVSYTTNSLIVSPLRAGLSLLFNHILSPRSLWAAYTPAPTMDKELIKREESKAYKLDPRFLRYTGGQTMWESSILALEHGLGHTEPVFIDEELVLSKAFATSMKPSKIIPYFYRASGPFEEDDITITTLVTSSRFGAFSQLIERYKGPISVTIHVANITGEIRGVVRSLKSLHAASRNMATYVDVHLVIDAFDRQFNTWRNIARFFARTDYIMMLDVDFYLCTDFRSAIRNSPFIMDKLRAKNAALVVPAFEYTKYADGLDPTVFPKDKRALLGLVKSKRIGMFHAAWVPGHNSTDYKRFYAAPPGDVYKVTQYAPAYEPCDERFIGYGGNKAACLFEMYISGISYYVLADHFIIHQSHRYLKMFNELGLSNSTQAANALQECKGRKRNTKLVGSSSGL